MVATLLILFLVFPVLVVHSEKEVSDTSKEFIYQPDILKETLFPSKSLVIEVTKDTPYLRQEEAKRVAAAQRVKSIPKSSPVPKFNSNLPSNYDHLLAQYDWPVTSARAVMLCESGGVADRHNYNPATKDNSWGLYQVNLWGGNARTRPPATELIKPEVNIAYAYGLYISQGRRFGTTGGWFNCARKLGIH